MTTLYQLYPLLPLLHYSQCGKWAFSAKKVPACASHLGYHVGEESQRSDHLVWSMTWTWRRAVSAMNVHACLRPKVRSQTRSYSGRNPAIYKWNKKPWSVLIQYWYKSHNRFSSHNTYNSVIDTMAIIRIIVL